MTAIETKIQQGILNPNRVVATSETAQEAPHPFAASITQAMVEVKNNPLSKDDRQKAGLQLSEITGQINFALDPAVEQTYAVLRRHLPPPKVDPQKAARDKKDFDTGPSDDIKTEAENKNELDIGVLSDRQLFALVLKELGKEEELTIFLQCNPEVFNIEKSEIHDYDSPNTKQWQKVEQALAKTLHTPPGLDKIIKQKVQPQTIDLLDIR